MGRSLGNGGSRSSLLNQYRRVIGLVWRAIDELNSLHVCWIYIVYASTIEEILVLLDKLFSSFNLDVQ